MPSSTFVADLVRARTDIDFFCERFLGIKGHPGQQRLWKAIMQRDDSGWRPEFLNIDVAAGNRAGKTLGIAIPLFHNTLFKLGMKPPDYANDKSVNRWARAPYEAYHFGISQEIAELAFIEIQRILLGTHEAQKAGCPLTEEVGQIVSWEKKYRGEYLWMQIDEQFGGGDIHFRTTGEKAIGSLGKDMNLISYDEAGLDTNFHFVLNEVLHLRRLSTGGQLWIIGTATEGITEFADHWDQGDPTNPTRLPDSFSMRMSTRDNIGYGIDQVMFDRVVAQVPPDLIPQNIDGFFIRARSAYFDAHSVDLCFVDGLPELEPAHRGHAYTQGVDPALKLDSTWSIVVDENRRDSVLVGVKAERITGRSTGPRIAALTNDTHELYNRDGADCVTGVDATGFGGALFRDSITVNPVIAVQFGGTRQKKIKLLNNLRDWIEQGRLKFPRVGLWLDLRRQLLGYKLDDKHLSTDAVMALAVIIAVVGPPPSKETPLAMHFDYFYGVDPTTKNDPPPKSEDVVALQRQRLASHDWSRFNTAVTRLMPREDDEYE